MIGLLDIFQHTVATGWRPRSVAVGAELERLEASHIRGTCVAPLTVDGDTVFIDRHTPPQPGDLVAFALSRRGCEAQNSDLPPGQTPWAPGSRWVKLLAEYHGLQMLLDKYGGAATATLLACEHPDDTPVLHPVRNIMRGGRLLYGPDTYAGQIGLSAATVMYSTTIGSTTISYSGTSLASLTVGPFAEATDLVITFSGVISATNSSATLNGAAWGNTFFNLTATDFSTAPQAYSGGYVPTSSTEVFSVSVERLVTIAANTTTTYYLNSINTGSTNVAQTLTSGTYKIESIKR